MKSGESSLKIMKEYYGEKKQFSEKDFFLNESDKSMLNVKMTIQAML